jgi:hypothetical protein
MANQQYSIDNSDRTDDTAFTVPGDEDGGAGGQEIGGALMGTEPIIEHGREIVVELENTGTESGVGSLGVVYLEE